MIRIHKWMVVDNEHLYGPGRRLLLYLKGCSLHCEGCINQHLWAFEGGSLLSPEEVFDICEIERVSGITIHGGEPLDQAAGLLELVRLAKAKNLTVILFTGYIKKELDIIQKEIWNMSDIVVAGRFLKDKRNVNLQFRGSTNQRVYTHPGPYKGYKVTDGFTTAILTINENGSMDVNGFLTDDIAKLVDESK